MSLRNTIADKLVSKPFYIIDSANGHGSIKSLGLREIFSYVLRTGRLPTNPKITLVGSGGAAKGFAGAGVVKLLDELGVNIHRYILSSVSSLFAIYEVTGKNYKAFEEFVLGVPDWIDKRPLPLLARGDFNPFKKLGQVYTLTRKRKHQTKNGSVITNQGILTNEKLEKKLRDLCGNTTIGDLKKVIIMAIDYTRDRDGQRVVALGNDYPDMPVYKAILAGIAIPKVMPHEHFDERLFGDGAAVYHFPLIKDLMPADSKTVIAIMLSSKDDFQGPTDYSGVNGFILDEEVRYEITKREVKNLLARLNSDTTIDDLVSHGDKNLRIKVIHPPINGIPPRTIKIDIEKRLELIAQGYQAAREALKDFRRPLFSSEHAPSDNSPYIF